jgi:hypothetical protein
MALQAVSLIVCLVGSLIAQNDSAPEAARDIKPGRITYEDVAYPYPYPILSLTLYGQDVRVA